MLVMVCAARRADPVTESALGDVPSVDGKRCEALVESAFERHGRLTGADKASLLTNRFCIVLERRRSLCGEPSRRPQLCRTGARAVFVSER